MQGPTNGIFVLNHAWIFLCLSNLAWYYKLEILEPNRSYWNCKDIFTSSCVHISCTNTYQCSDIINSYICFLHRLCQYVGIFASLQVGRMYWFKNIAERKRSNRYLPRQHETCINFIVPNGHCYLANKRGPWTLWSNWKEMVPITSSLNFLLCAVAPIRQSVSFGIWIHFEESTSTGSPSNTSTFALPIDLSSYLNLLECVSVSLTWTAVNMQSEKICFRYNKICLFD